MLSNKGSIVNKVDALPAVIGLSLSEDTDKYLNDPSKVLYSRTRGAMAKNQTHILKVGAGIKPLCDENIT